MTAAEVVAIATRCDAEGSCARVALASGDGLAWDERASLPADVAFLGDLVSDEAAILAVGRDAAGRGAIWRSGDGGATWQRAGHREAFAPGADGRRGRSPSGNAYEVSVLAVTRGPAGLVAVGWLNSEDLDRTGTWTSPDGETWERLRLGRSMDRTGGAFDIAASDAAYVAVTAKGLFHSRDGQRWQRATVADGDAPILDVEAADVGFVGLGVRDAGGSIWMSGPFGGDWLRQPDDPALAALWEADLRSIGPRLVAVGTRTGEQLTPTVWTLRPGSAWTAETVTFEQGARLEDVVAIGGRLLVVGATEGLIAGGSAGAAWQRPLGG